MTLFRQTVISGKRLLFDGAMGTILQERGLAPGENPEEFCLGRPEILRDIHAQYVAAGADVIISSTFGGTRFKLPSHLSVEESNRRLARIAREAADSSGRKVFVAGSVGPSGMFLQPLGEISFEELTRAFQEQIRGLAQGGADVILAETQFDIAEARAIVAAARRECGLPVAVSITYEDGLTLTGSDVAVCAATLANLGADLIGMNCSAGPEEMRDAAAALLSLSPAPVLIQPNAGLPLLENGVTTFPLGAEAFAARTLEFARQGAQALGGCCGTTPAHIAALKKAMDGLPATGPRPEFSGIAVTSRSRVTRLGKGHPFCVIGERINPTGKKRLSEELVAGDFSTAYCLADEQVAAGCPVLDVNVGAPMADEILLLPNLASRLAARHSVPLCLDSSHPQAIIKALAAYPASPLVNSISGEEGRMELLGPVCRDFGAPFILLPLRGKKLPVTASERIAIVEDLLDRMDALAIPRRLALVDSLALTVSSSPEAARECLAFIRYCDETLGLPTTCGLSNISFGLPARGLINTGFLGLAAGAGLCSCIANPGDLRISQTVDAINLLLGHDRDAERFIGLYAGWKEGETPGGGRKAANEKETEARPRSRDVFGAGAEETISEKLGQAVIAGRREEIEALVRTALESGAEPFALVDETLIPAITEVGDKYARKEYFLPQLLRSAETMQTAFAILRPFLEKDSRTAARPPIILATVEGDIHDIGKNIVGLMLGNHGFDVVDLGKDVRAEDIVAAAVERKACLIGLSALMTTTMTRMRDTVDLVREKNLDIKVLVGGAVVTDDFARAIGAHYAKDAVETARLARNLL